MRHGKKPEVIEKIQNTLWSTKARKIATSVTAGVIVLALIGGGIYHAVNPGSDSAPEKPLETIEKELFTEEDLDGVISGLDDHYILVDSTDIDYLHDVQANDDIIVGVDVDDSKVKMDKPGKYKVTYTVTVDTDKLQEYIETENKAVGNDQDKSGEGTATDEVEENVSEKNTSEIVIEKEIEIVDEETAKDLANKGEIVWTDNSETLPKDDGTVTPTPEPEKPIENAVTPEPTPVPSKPDSKKEENKDDKKNNSSSNSNNSGNSSGSSGNSGNSSSSPSKPAEHKHNWVAQTTSIPHAAEGYYKTVEVEPAVYEYRSICNQCGEDITNNVDMHFADSPNCGGYSNKKIKIKDAVTQQQWVETKAAWTETKTTGYKCSGCGATK